MTSFQSDEEAVSRMSSFERVFTSPHAGRVAAAAGPAAARVVQERAQEEATSW
jgi:hypothetical protein